MSKRPTDMRQQSRRMEVMADQDAKKVRRFFLPNGL
jgi:large subunit ribosomal protein L35